MAFGGAPYILVAGGTHALSTAFFYKWQGTNREVPSLPIPFILLEMHGVPGKGVALDLAQNQPLERRMDLDFSCSPGCEACGGEGGSDQASSS